MKDGKKILVIAPCYNEEKKIPEVVRRVQEMNERIVDEMLVVDDGSTDESANIVEKMGATVIRLGAVIGVGAAIRRGYEYAQEKGYDIVVIMAGNNKDEPNEIPELIDPILKGDSDFVQGSRFLKKSNRGSMPFYRKIATRLHPMIFSLFVGKKVTESTNGFRAFNIKLLKDERINLNQKWLDQYELEPYFYYKVIRLGYRTSEVACTKVYPPKKLGYTKMKPITGWWSILRPLFYLRFGIRS